MLLESFSSLRGLSTSQYTFGVQAIPLVASGVYTLFWPSAAAALPNSPLKDIGDGTIQAIRYALVPESLLLPFKYQGETYALTIALHLYRWQPSTRLPPTKTTSQ